MPPKEIQVGGHSVRRGYFLHRVDVREDNDGGPIRFYKGIRRKNLRYLRRLADRFNRIQMAKRQATKEGNI